MRTAWNTLTTEITLRENASAWYPEYCAHSNWESYKFKHILRDLYFYISLPHILWFWGPILCLHTYSFAVESEKCKSFHHIWLFATPWTVAHWALLCMGFPRQEYWSGLPFSSHLQLQSLLHKFFYCFLIYVLAYLSDLQFFYIFAFPTMVFFFL